MEQLTQRFRERYGFVQPSHCVTAPGRINLIGEHIDYNGLSVFPMALDRRVKMLFRPNGIRTIRVSNADKRFPPLDFTISSLLEPYPEGEWGNYVKAAVQELIVLFLELNGFDAVVTSDIPAAAGLSSSSALVVATALALMRANDLSMDRIELMKMLAKAERYVGTEGGGMDQAICIGAVEGTATRIDFDPISLTSTTVPNDWRFVVANSMVRAEKSGAARDEYNRRTRECREALRSVASKLGLNGEVSTYPELLSKVPVNDVMAAAQVAIPGTLGRRFLHVVTEAVRVSQAEQAMREADADRFGRLMSDSHRSLRDEFEVSGPELDELTEIAADAGALGARLTGAGFGGCIIALCKTDTVGAVLSALQRRYYSLREIHGRPRDVLFVARPGGGAGVTELPENDNQGPVSR